MDKLAIGRIGKSHGIKGYFRVHSLSGETGHFSQLKQIFVPIGDHPEPFCVESVRVMSSRLIMKLQGISSREEAKKLAGKVIWVDRKYASPLRKGEYYIADLVGCGVYQQKQLVGRIKSVMSGGGGADILEVEVRQGEAVMVPFAQRFVGKVNIKAKKLFLQKDFTIP
jgi:16S rRNA processing protein RimM